MPNFEQQPKTADQLTGFQKRFLEGHKQTLNEQLSDLGEESLAKSEVLKGAEERLAALYFKDASETDIVAERDKISAEVRAELAEATKQQKPAEASVVSNEEGFDVSSTYRQGQTGAERRNQDRKWLKGE